MINNDIVEKMQEKYKSIVHKFNEEIMSYIIVYIFDNNITNSAFN